MSAVRILLVILGGMALLNASGAGAHPFHSSYAEVDWSSDGRRLEVALRVIPEDLEAALSRQQGEAMTLVQHPRVLAAIETYLQTSFEVLDTNGDAQPLSLTGFEAGYRETWLYFTVDAARDESLALRNRVLLDEDITQRNQTRRLWETGPEVLVFTAERPEQALWSP